MPVVSFAGSGVSRSSTRVCAPLLGPRRAGSASKGGARIFTPVRLLPFEHPEALNHQFPTVLQFHAGEDRLLVTLGRSAGLLLGSTLQRYPMEPDTAWPYAPIRRPPADRFDAVSPRRKPAADVPWMLVYDRP